MTLPRPSQNYFSQTNNGDEMLAYSQTTLARDPALGKGKASDHSMQQSSRKAWRGTRLQTYLVGRVQSSAHFHSSQGNSKCRQVWITHCAWQRVSLAARTNTEHSRGIPKETRTSQAEEEVHMQGWACGEPGWPCLGTDSSLSSSLFSWAEAL